jgi:protein-S-isoprenylcysteine O-methyltransferase Ste14
MSHRTKDLPPLTGIAHAWRELRYHEASRQVLSLALIALFVTTAMPRPWAAGLGIPLVTLGMLVRLYASGFISKNTELATDGPYAFVRHPLYTGNVLIILGFSILSGRWWAPPITLLYFWMYLPAAIRYEDQKLRRLFGAAWDRWAARTPALVPTVRNASQLGPGGWSLMRSLRRNGEPLIALALVAGVIWVVEPLV